MWFKKYSSKNIFWARRYPCSELVTFRKIHGFWLQLLNLRLLRAVQWRIRVQTCLGSKQACWKSVSQICAEASTHLDAFLSRDIWYGSTNKIWILHNIFDSKYDFDNVFLENRSQIGVNSVKSAVQYSRFHRIDTDLAPIWERFSSKTLSKSYLESKVCKIKFLGR